MKPVDAGPSRRVLFAPVPLAPTKPLTLSHVKGLLWSDVMHRATGLLHKVDLLYSWTVGVVNTQCLGFWAYLDETRPGMDFGACEEEDIGALYVTYQRQRSPGDAPGLSAQRAAAEGAGPVHPACARILDLWAERLRELGIADPGLRARRQPPMSLDALVALLTERGLCVDHSPWRGPVYLDGTERGLPLRPLVGADGSPNYLAGVLRELVPLIGAYDDFVLTCDRDSFPDYVLLRQVLNRLGARVSLFGFGRVRTGGGNGAAGQPLTTRHGGWQGLTAMALAREFLDLVGPEVYRLGLRLYFIATLGRGDRESHRPELVWRCMARAASLLRRAAGAEAATPLLLHRHARPHAYVDPYRLTTALLTRGRTVADASLLDEVYI
jgi:hypothetical protein